MRQKITIAVSVLLLLLAVFLIARDLFRKPQALTDASCCGDEFSLLKQIDTTFLGYKKIGVIETGVTGLNGIAMTEDKRLFVCGNRQVLVFDSSGKKTAVFAVDSVSNCIAVDGNLFYLGVGSAIESYSVSGNKKSQWTPLNPDGFITSVKVNRGYVYAADAVSKVILKYSSEGKLIQEIGRKDTVSGATGFIIPSLYFDIAFGAFDDLWAVNPGRLKIENYSANGYLRSVWEVEASDNNRLSGCCNPAHFTILPDGSFVTYEKGVDKIKVFDPTGSFICFVAGAGSFRGNTDLQLNGNLVKDMTADNDGLIYVLDAYSQINIFKKRER